MKTYALQTQNNDILDKEFQWTSEIVAKHIFTTPHRDIALNQLVELNAKDASLRAEVVEYELGPNGVPLLSADAISKEQIAANTDQSSAA
ncbi:MAG: hypothetical protein HOA40_03005 [Porticoccaceae bacterium]|jgi:hypothetical protein|nr:hypothetical protein [Porticoccaceae bacterium]MBT4163581.1 hypothetical protein [Porticoccaceae bacterium]MBT4211602.1 hypothetical protein [Porticoccaceae bacterium]MBT5104512.1 hypothetical protein [Porticoccaceae bacterium]MBT6798517.1 hypothetical protein [Porticoccaceae bacterium]